MEMLIALLLIQLSSNSPSLMSQLQGQGDTRKKEAGCSAGLSGGQAHGHSSNFTQTDRQTDKQLDNVTETNGTEAVV